MLAKSRDWGPVLLCDACQTEIVALGKVLWKFNGKPSSNVLIVHDHCEQSSIVDMLLPSHHKQPLNLYLECLLEKISV